MPNSSSFATQLQPLLKWIFIALSIAMLALLCYQIPQGIKIETNLQALFPQDKDNQLSEKVNDQLLHAFGNKILLAVQAPSIAEVKIAADVLALAISENPLLHLSSSGDNAQLMAQQQKLLQDYRYQLLTPAQYQQLDSGNFSALIERAQAALFGFSSGASGLTPLQDPLNIHPAYSRQLQPALNGELLNDRLLLPDEQGHLILFALSLEGESFNIDLQEQISLWLQDLHSKLAANSQTAASQVLVSGVVFHAAEASRNAKAEMSIIGTGDILGSVLLFILTFFRIKPLLLTLASVGYGFALSLAFNILLFGNIHLMTLVFGTSLIGVAIDYSVHYLCKHQKMFTPGSDRSTSRKIIEKLLPALTLGLLASIVGYACLLQPALPGLKQIASFSIIGLCGSWLFVVVTYPLFVTQPLPQAHPLISRCAFLVWRFWAALTGASRRWLLAGLLLLIAAGMLKFHFSSDVRTLYKPSAPLMASEQRLQHILQGVSANQYFLLRAADAQSLLQLEENFRREHLDPLVAAGALKAYSATSSIVPSELQQRKNYQLMAGKIYSDSGLARDFMQSAGFDSAAIQQVQQAFASADQQQLQIEDWLKVARPDQALLWLGKLGLGKSGNEYVSIIGLQGIADVAALAAAANTTSIVWVNRVSDMSQLILHLTEAAASMLVLAYAVTLLLLWISYRTAKALLLVSVPLMTTLLTLSLLSLYGEPITLFHIFGCYLILGLGMDYSIFSYSEGLKDEVSQRSIWLSAVTGGLSFGLLVLSSTPMVSAFGITLLLGCLFNLWFAPLVGGLKPKPNTENSLGHEPI